jgi:hypothetical protein
MLALLTILAMLAVAYAYQREGVFTAFTMCVNVFLAGLIAFNFWEPAADWLEGVFEGTVLLGYEDALCLIGIFTLTLGLLRLATNNLAPSELMFPLPALRGGGAFFGLVTGYFAAGFLVCVWQTLPWHVNFMAFEPNYRDNESAVRRFLPPDRVWLAAMRRAGTYTFANQLDENNDTEDSLADKYLTFDRYGTFELRYARYRRFTESRDPLFYRGELDGEIYRHAMLARPPSPSQ